MDELTDGRNGMKKLGLIATLLSVFFVTACTATEDTTNNVLKADIHLPDQLLTNSPSTFTVHVTDGEMAVDDAEKVIFNIWKAGSEDETETIHAEEDETGAYQVTTNFQEDGLYYVQTQISANNLRAMPKKQFIVGKLSENDINALTKQADQSNEEKNHQHH